MSIDADVAEDLTRSGAPTHKFEAIGDTLKLRISSVRKSQQTDFQTNEPLTWPNGDPKYQFEFAGTDLATSEETRIFAKGQMLTAIKEAFRTAEAKPEVDGVLTVKFHEEEPSKTRGFNPMKVYRAKYEPPAPVADFDDI